MGKIRPIDANVVLKKLQKSLIKWIRNEYCDAQLANVVNYKIRTIIKETPTLESALMNPAHWIVDEVEYTCTCSNCKEDGSYWFKYCPNCGAKMENSETDKCVLHEKE